MSVKRTIGITLSVIVLVGVASNTIPAYAEELKEMYVDYAQDVQIVITNKPCIKWETPKDVQLNYAYAVNLKNKDMITGCYTHDDKNIIIQLTDESNKKHYEFKITPEAFKSRSTL